MKQLLLILSLLAVSFWSAQAQQLPFDNQYQLNKYALSPAYAGLTQNIEVFMSMRQNWLGVEGAPQLQIISGNAPLQKQSMGLGLTVRNEKTGNFSHFYFAPAYAYHLKLSDDMKLSFGLAGEVYRNQLSNIVSPTIDPFVYNYQSILGTAFNASAGFVFAMKGLNLGVTVPRVLDTKINYNKELLENTYTLKRHYQVHLSYLLVVKEKIKVEPVVIVRSTETSPLQYEGSVMANYGDKIWTSINYRKGNAFGISVGAALNKNIVLNYTYEFATSGIMNYSSGTHEIGLGFLVKKNELEKPPPTIFSMEPDIKMPEIDPELEEKVAQLEAQLSNCDCSSKDETIAELDKRLKKLEGNLDDLDADLWEEAFVIENIKFGNNSDRLFSSSFPELNKLAKKLQDNPEWQLRITGYTDNVGSPKYNERLSENRAASVKKYLESRGIDGGRVETFGKGMENPVGDNNTQDGRAQNRRIEGQFKKK